MTARTTVSPIQHPPWPGPPALPHAFFDQPPLALAQALLGKVLRRRLDGLWLSARIIETEAYCLDERGSHASLGFTAKRAPLFEETGGMLYLYYARGGDSLNIGAHGAGNAVLIKSGHCRLLQVPGAGTEQIAFAALPPECTVANVHGHEIPIAEFVTHAILEHALEPWRLPAVLDEASWPSVYAGRPLHHEAHGRTVTLVGYGHIGREVAQRARALGMHVVALTRRGGLNEADGVHESHPVRALFEVLPRTDVLVLCCPLDDATRGMIGREALAALPAHAMLVNVARAEVVDEAALHAALTEGRLARAVLDVWYQYPKPGETALAPSRLGLHRLPNVRATPHVSAMTPGLLARRYAVIAENIQRLAAGEPLRYVVRPPH